MEIGTEIRLVETIERRPGHITAPAGVRGIITTVLPTGEKPFEVVLDLRSARMPWPEAVKRSLGEDAVLLPEFQQVVALMLKADQFIVEEAQGFDEAFEQQVTKLTGLYRDGRKFGFDFSQLK